MSAGRPPGVEFHTFTVLGRCPRTGRLGVATATRSLAAAARASRSGARRLGAVAIMAIAGRAPRLHAPAALELGYRRRA